MQNLSIDTGLSALPTTQNKELFDELNELYNAIRIIVGAIDSYTGASHRLLFGASIAYGKAIYLYNVAGVTTVGLADATTSAKPMRGWCSQKAGVVSGAYGDVMLGGIYTGTSFTPGATYYLSDTPGSLSLTAGTVSQKVGFALSTTELLIRPAL